MRIASYNIHGGIGRDGRLDLTRILAVLQELDCHIIALQEMAPCSDDACEPLQMLASGTGCAGIAGPILARAYGHHGNALLTRLPIRAVRRLDLSVPGHEPRGALVAELDWDGHPLLAAATHLGLMPGERRRQVRALLSHLPLERGRQHLLMGDINEWFLWGRPLRWLHARFGRPPAPATFPSGLPLLALDRIWAHPGHALRRVWTHDSALARVASDHLPILAELARPRE